MCVRLDKLPLTKLVSTTQRNSHLRADALPVCEGARWRHADAALDDGLADLPVDGVHVEDVSDDRLHTRVGAVRERVRRKQRGTRNRAAGAERACICEWCTSTVHRTKL